ncbi:Protein kinase domain-containing protein [Entamoeba marina]
MISLFILMSVPQDTTPGALITIVPCYDTNLGKLEFGQTIDFIFKITCSIPKIKANVEMDEVKLGSVVFQTTSTKNLKIIFKANRGGIVKLVFKVEKLKGNKSFSDDDLKTFKQRIELKYQTELSIIDSITENEIEFKAQISKNSNSTVYKALYDGEIVFIKTYVPGSGMEESKKMLYFRNKFITEYKKSFYREIDNQKQFCSMLEYTEYGSLENVKNLIEQPILYKIIEDVCNAIQYLHQVKHVIHRDIKPQKILIFNYDKICDVNAKLTDFGTCEVINNDGNYGKVGTDYFMAPEVVKGQKYSVKCDIYSLGITMLNLFLNAEDFDNSVYDYIQPNGTCINTTTVLKKELRDLIMDCCQIDPFKRPDINQCLNRIQDIRKTLIDDEQKDVKYSLPKFDLLKVVKDVVQSIKRIEKVLESMSQNQYSLENKGDSYYASARYYLKKNDIKLKNKIYELMINAAKKSQPDAIMYLINVLIDIVDGKITINDEEKGQINEIISKVYDMNMVPKDVSLLSQYPIQQENDHVIPTIFVMDTLLLLRKYVPICEFQYGIALLHGDTIAKKVINAKPLFNSFIQSKYCYDPQEVEFYQSYCKIINTNIQENMQEAYDMLSRCIKYSENQYYYPYALNNLGLLLYDGLGYNRDISKAIECFEKAAKQNVPEALFNLGNIYLKGNGVEKDINKAIEFFEKAAKQNVPEALFNLGDLYLNGNGVEKDEKIAITYLEKSANLKYKLAIQKLQEINSN